MIPEYIKKEALEIWPGINPDNLRCDCEDCQDVAVCEYSFDMYNLYTTDGDITNIGTLCLK